MSFSIAATVSRLSPPAVRSTSIPRFAAGASVHSKSWEDWASRSPSETLRDFLSAQVVPATEEDGKENASAGRPPPKVIIFGEQHHQPKVLAAQLQLLHTLATEPFNLKVTVVMEHFNLLQQKLLDEFAKTGDAGPLQEEYAKSSEGFRIDNSGYLPLLNLARELDNVNSAVVAGFPPREWARTIMRQGQQGLQQDQQVTASKSIEVFNRWDDLNVSSEHAAYIASSISGEKPEIPAQVQQGGLKAAQAFKDAIMAWKIDQLLQRFSHADQEETHNNQEVIVAICGSGHCEYDFGITERIRSCRRDEILLVVCKPHDGGYWTASSDDETARRARALADGIIVYDAVDS